MKQVIVSACIVGLSSSLAACNKDKEAESPEMSDAVDKDGPMEEAGEWTDQAAEDTSEAAQEAADETSDEFDGDPATD